MLLLSMVFKSCEVVKSNPDTCRASAATFLLRYQSLRQWKVIVNNNTNAFLPVYRLRSTFLYKPGKT